MQTYQDPRQFHKKNNSRKVYVIAFIVIILCISGWVFYVVTKDPWYCKDGKWITDKVTDKPIPTDVCPQDTNQELADGNEKPDQKYIDIDSEKNAEGIDIHVFTPHVNATITSPLEVTGEAMNWYFENAFDVLLIDTNGDVIAKDIARATDDVVEDAYVRFETKLTFDVGNDIDRGNIVFQKSEGLNEEGSFSFPVFFE
jgi:hypothetical protein